MNNPLRGDVKIDDKVDALDLRAVVDATAKGGFNPTADVNNDGKIDVSDIITIISIMSEAK